MRRRILSCLWGVWVLGAIVGAQQPPPPTSGVDLAALDRSVDACTDFYRFACGGWLAANPLPPDRRSFGRFAELRDRNFQTLRHILESRPASGDLRKAADYYTACMDEAAIERNGLAPLRPELARIDALTSRDEVPAYLAHLHDLTAAPGAAGRSSAPPLFGFGAAQDRKDARRQIATVRAGIGAIPDREAYLKIDDRSVALREKYTEHVRQMLSLAGQPPEEAAAGARAVLRIETALAQAALDAVARRNPSAVYHPMTPVELQQLTPAFDWNVYLKTSRVAATDPINVSQPALVRQVNDIVADTPLSDLKQYFRWQLLHAHSLVLPTAFRQADFEFFSRVLQGQEAPAPRWRDCVTDTDLRLGEALGTAFVEQTFAAPARHDARALVAGIKAAMRADIEQASWMSEETKQAALTKLNAVVDRIGYPDTWRSYAALDVSASDPLGNLQRSMAFDRRRDLTDIGSPVDLGRWSMTTPTVNAYYSQAMNNINFPAGILQPPFYLAGRDAAVNYGGAGAVVGHELTHGFDDQGRRFDAKGNLRDWWTPADGKAFEERAACVADQYGEFVVAGDTHLNGRLTLGENTADNGGLRLALMAYLAGPGATAAETLDGFTSEQRFFLGFAQIWCEQRRPEYERLQAATDPHSPGRYRVNGTLSNMPEFRKAFGCRADAPMVRKNACRVW